MHIMYIYTIIPQDRQINNKSRCKTLKNKNINSVLVGLTKTLLYILIYNGIQPTLEKEKYTKYSKIKSPNSSIYRDARKQPSSVDTNGMN